ncbi:MAG: hypothetical protein RLZZ338_4869 [Cyanobacteriota bacterium]
MGSAISSKPNPNTGEGAPTGEPLRSRYPQSLFWATDIKLSINLYMVILNLRPTHDNMKIFRYLVKKS